MDNIIETLQVPLILRPPAVAPGHKAMGILSLLPVPTIGRCPGRKGAAVGSTPPWSFPLQSPPPVHIASAPPGVFPWTVVSCSFLVVLRKRKAHGVSHSHLEPNVGIQKPAALWFPLIVHPPARPGKCLLGGPVTLHHMQNLEHCLYMEKPMRSQPCGDALGFTLGSERGESHTPHGQRTMLAAFLPHQSVSDRPGLALRQGAVSS